MNRNDAEFNKFIETSDGKVAIRLKLSDDSYIVLDARYVKKSGDTMTGSLILSPTTGDNALTIKADCNLYFDGS